MPVMVLQSRDMLPITPRGSLLIAVSVVMSVFVILVVGLRMVRNVKFKKFGWDEVLIIVATIILLACAGLSIASVPFGNGRHVYEIPNLFAHFNAIQLPWASQPLFAGALLIAKASLAVTLLKLGLGKTFNWIVLGSVAIITIADIWSIIQIVAGCNPKANPAAGPCHSSTYSVGIAYFQCSANVFVDLVFFLAPEFFLRKTKLHARDRLAIRCLLGFVFAATIMSIVKIVYLRLLLATGDVTFNSPAVSDASLAECGLSIIAACLPAVRQLFGQKFPRHWMFWKHNTDYSTGSKWTPATPVSRKRLSSLADLENGKRAMNVKIMNDLDFREEDRDAVELISYSSRSNQTTLAATSPEVNKPLPTPASDSIAEPLIEPELAALKPETSRSGNMDDLQGRLASRYNVHVPRRPLSVSFLPSQVPQDMTGPVRDARPSSVAENTITEQAIDRRSIRDSQSNCGLSSTSSSRSSSPEPRHPSLMVQARSPVLNSQAPEIHDIPETIDEHEDEDKVAARGERYYRYPDPGQDDSLPMAPFYFENKKIRRSARPSFDQQLTYEPPVSVDHTRASTLDNSSLTAIKAINATWLRDHNNSSPALP